MALDTSGFVPKGNLDANSEALGKSGQKATLLKVFKLLKKYTPLILLSLILAIVSVVFTLLVPIRIGNAVDSILGDGNELSKILAEAALFAVIVGVSQYVMNLLNNRICYLTVRDISP